MKQEDLYKIDLLAYNTKIGIITNNSTTMYEMLSKEEKDSVEYDELEKRLKLCCKLQSAEIDSAKGIKSKGIPKHWTSYQKDGGNSEFNNYLLINDRPYFMRYLYLKYNKNYKDITKDFDKFCKIKYACSFEELKNNENFNNTKDFKELEDYRNKKIGLLNTNGVMNRICCHMEKELKEVKKTNKKCDNEFIYSILFNDNVDTDISKLDSLIELRKKYTDFRKNKMLSSSNYATYEQFYKGIRNEALSNISNNIKELANLSVYLCYKITPKKPKDFCWDCFGKGIYENLLEKNDKVYLPMENRCDTINENEIIKYLGKEYYLEELELTNEEDLLLEEDFDNIFD